MDALTPAERILSLLENVAWLKRSCRHCGTLLYLVRVNGATPSPTRARGRETTWKTARATASRRQDRRNRYSARRSRRRSSRSARGIPRQQKLLGKLGVRLGVNMESTMIGIQLAGKKDRIRADVFVRTLSSFLDLLKDVDSVVSKQIRGSVRWELAGLEKNSPALAQFAGVSRIQQMDYSRAIQESVLDGLEQLTERPELPQFYSYSALRKVRQMSGQSKHLKWLSVFAGSRRTMLTQRVSANVEYLMASGSKSFGSIRGSLDAIIVHSGHEFRVWSPKWTRPVTCSFDKGMLQQVTAHLKQRIEVIGELQRNEKGDPFFMNVHEFIALEPVTAAPRVKEMCGLLSGLYDQGVPQDLHGRAA